MTISVVAIRPAAVASICAPDKQSPRRRVAGTGRRALANLGQDGPKGLFSEIALVAHGGYGRRDVAPYSDVDLMILRRSARPAA